MRFIKGEIERLEKLKRFILVRVLGMNFSKYFLHRLIHKTGINLLTPVLTHNRGGKSSEFSA